ncbi:MAG: pyridoxamine 5'-phosphate oxidase family protein [Gammaproteobacteria bacterium]|nr:pyridoxamine 5'-phosphate oxidase family protein [Gammaproteobacteria bacterium]MCP5198854.1 pyridoxamine 5'-phosphate oxidase family protein [Gammaproteobacteria bacterium]
MLDHLREAMGRYAAPPHLLTTGADGRPHATATTVVWDGDTLVLEAGRRSLANLAHSPRVALLWSPSVPGEYSLVIDAELAAPLDADRATVSLAVTRGVLHRPATPAGPRNPACGSDCVPLYG